MVCLHLPVHLPLLGAVLVSTLLLGPRAHGSIDVPPLPTLRQGEKLTLQQAVRLADEHNRTLRVARISLQTAAAKIKAARAPLFPNLYGKLTYYFRDHADTVEQNGATLETRPRNELTAGLEARMTLVDAGRYTLLRVAKTEQEIAVLGVEELRQELLYTVAEAYFQAAALQRLIAVYENQSHALQLHLETAKARYRSGVGALVDVKRAETDIVAIREEQIRALFALERSRDALALLIGSSAPPLPVDSPLSVTALMSSAMVPPASPLTHRWDLQIAQKQVVYNKQILRSLRTAFAPTLTAFWQLDLALTTPEIPTDYDRTRWFAGASLNIPLFDYTFTRPYSSKRRPWNRPG